MQAHLPLPLYKKIYASVPLPCVDLVVEDSSGRFLLVRRKNQPEQGKWWLPGGRLLRGETLKAAALRKLTEETGLRGKAVGLLGVYEYFAVPGTFPGTTAHNILLVYHMRTAGASPRVRLDSQSAAYRWWAGPRPSFHPYVKQFLGAVKARRSRAYNARRA